MNPTFAGGTNLRPVEQPIEGALSVVEDGSRLAPARQAEFLVPATNSIPVAAPVAITDPKAILSSLRRRWFLALSLGVFVGGLGAGIAWFAIPDTYVAYAELKVQTSSKSLLFQDVGNRGTQFLTFRQTQARLLTGPFVLQAAMRNPDVARLGILKEELHPLEWLEKNLAVSMPATEFMRLSLRGREPADLAIIVNAVTAAYLEEAADLESKERMKRRNDLEKAREELIAKKKFKDNRLRRLVETVGATSDVALSHAELANVELYAKYRAHLADLEFERSRQEWQLQRMQEGFAGAPPLEIPPEVLEARMLQEPNVATAQAEVDKLERKLEVNKLALKPGTKKLLDAEEELKKAEANVAIAKTKAREQVEKRLREEISKQSTATVASLENDIRHNSDEINKVKGQLEKQTIAKKAVAVQSLELSTLQKEIAQDERIEGLLREEVRKIDIESTGDKEARISIFRKAETPHFPDMSKKIKVVGMSGIGGLGFVVVGILWLDLRTRRINSLEEIAGGLRLPVLGLLPTVPKRIASSHDPNAAGSGVQGVWQGTLMESVDAARVMLLRRAHLEKAKVAMVVSAIASEGKTTLACHLATSLARSGHKTLLVDADMRRPTVHRVFELPNEPGLCELLRREVELSEVVIPTAQDGLYMVPAGQLTHDALRELAQDGLGTIVKRMREEYDFVIFDSSPILPVTDSLMLSKHIDGSIVSIRRDVSQYPKVASACQRLAAMGVPIWGAVVIGLGHPSYGYRYAYTYGNSVKK